MLELQNLSFQVSDDTARHKEIIKDVSLTSATMPLSPSPVPTAAANLPWPS